MSNYRQSVLVVDDQVSWRKLIDEILGEEFDITSATNYETALELFREKDPPFNVVITDMRLVDTEPGNVDGLRLVEEINRINRSGDKTKTIVVTGYGSIETATRATEARQLHAHAYMQKSGLDPKSLLLTVREAANSVIRHDVFIIMPFASAYDATYEYIKETLDGMGLTSIRGDDVSQLTNYSDSDIMDQVVEGIRYARLVVAEISGCNPNVYYELGISKAMGKSIVLVSQGPEDEVGDMLVGDRVDFYDTSFSGPGHLQRKLKNQITGILSRKNEVPTRDEEVDPATCLSATPDNEDGKDTNLDIISKAAAAANLESKYAWDVYASSKRRADEIIAILLRSSIIIADLAEKDPDVFFIAGFAAGLGRDRILLIPESEHPPFDVRAGSLIKYSKRTQKDRSRARTEITGAIKTILSLRQSPGLPRSMQSTTRKGASRVSKENHRVDVVILTALPEEYRAVENHIADFKKWPGEADRSSLLAWHTGKIQHGSSGNSYQVAIGMLGRAGNENSALAVRDAISYWLPRYVFFVGIAGGLRYLEKGDVVLADTIYGYEYGKQEDRFIPRPEWNYETDLGLLTGVLAYGNQRTWLQGVSAVPPEICRTRFVSGTIASGDKVIDDPSSAFFESIMTTSPKIIAVEMEGLGAAKAARYSQDGGQTVGFTVVRGISDLPRPATDNGNDRGAAERDAWKEYASAVAAALTVGYIADGLPVPPRN